ncbi:MAG TPA: branched-chain amino acid ABC transporter permease [Geminicoccaceae bacterium]|jgi:branched-chain amino acid transport system permease protein|nr:branched-chain amino acid ABC transporter permease [Geminicoccaceae bacterium]
MLRRVRGFDTVLILLGLITLIAGATALLGSVVLTRFVITMFIDLVLVLGLQIFMGNTNILWFPHIGFMGIGAYGSVIFSMSELQKSLTLPHLYPFLVTIHLPFLPALLAGALVAAAVAAVVGLPLMRLSDFPAVITGFALLVIIHVVLTHWNTVTNGPQTLFGVDNDTGLGDAAVWAGAFVVVAWLFKESKVGLQLRASRDDLMSAGSIGVNVVAVRWLALVLSAFVAGIGGGLFAHFITSFTPKAFFLSETFVVLAMLVIGGPATVTGAVFGTVLVTIAYQTFRWLENTINVEQVFATNIAGLTDVALAIALILMLILRPAGLFERDEIDWRSLRRWARLPSSRKAPASGSRPA